MNQLNQTNEKKQRGRKKGFRRNKNSGRNPHIIISHSSKLILRKVIFSAKQTQGAIIERMVSWTLKMWLENKNTQCKLWNINLKVSPEIETKGMKMLINRRITAPLPTQQAQAAEK